MNSLEALKEDQSIAVKFITSLLLRLQMWRRIAMGLLNIIVGLYWYLYSQNPATIVCGLFAVFWFVKAMWSAGKNRIWIDEADKFTAEENTKRAVRFLK